MTAATLLALWACADGRSAETVPMSPEVPPMSAPEPSEALEHARNLRFRDNKPVFNDSARWLDTHRDEALPALAEVLGERGPAAIGAARVLGAMTDPRAVPLLEPALAADDDPLAFEAARALAATPGPEAEAALRRVAASGVPGAVKNAVRGIELRGDPSLCDALRPHLDAEEPIRSHARRAHDALDCP
jgi:hypothetical protein